MTESKERNREPNERPLVHLVQSGVQVPPLGFSGIYILLTIINFSFKYILCGLWISFLESIRWESECHRVWVALKTIEFLEAYLSEKGSILKNTPMFLYQKFQEKICTEFLKFYFILLLSLGDITNVPTTWNHEVENKDFFLKIGLVAFNLPRNSAWSFLSLVIPLLFSR